MLMANAGEVAPDGQNRILIPPELSSQVGISREVRILGMIRRIEIWSVEKFDAYLSDYGKTYEEVASQLLL
jgi:MraZ protein